MDLVTNNGLEEVVDDFSYDLSKNHISRNEIEDIMGMKPVKLENYRIALIHKSMNKIVINRKEHGVSVMPYMFFSNERLEFIGDAVFNLVTANYIFNKFPDKDEGFLTRIRTKIVRSSHCVIFAKYLNLEKFILTSNKVLQIKDRIHVNDRVLEDAFEAFIGAIYKDLGFKYAEMFIVNLIDKKVDFKEILKDDNYKDIIMRYTQSYGYELPIYKMVENNSVSKKFCISISLKKLDSDVIEEYGRGYGSSKKEAEQNAAKYACSIIDKSLTHIINRDTK